jgi:hypothetical protein
MLNEATVTSLAVGVGAGTEPGSAGKLIVVSGRIVYVRNE